MCRPESLGSRLHIVLSEHFIINVTLCFSANEIDNMSQAALFIQEEWKAFAVWKVICS